MTGKENQKMKSMSAFGLLVTLGIVFGDIGTSPLYVMKAITGVNPTFDADYILGAVSCVIWTLTLQTTIKYEKVFISVKDEGIGIPRDSMKKIWERFYKTDASRGKDKRGTGLGLSIVKEIITSHGEHINAISTEGVGTEFIFTLPRVPESEET